MFRGVAFVFALVALLLIPLTATAQEDEAAVPWIYATYSQCDLTQQWRADEIAKNVYAPVFDAALEDGKITGWGYLAHHTGGKWRRVIYHAGPSVDAVLDALDVIYDKIEEDNLLASREYSKICNAHDDYIWRFVAGFGGTEGALQERGPAGLSTYHVCDMATQDRADELVKEIFGPVYDRHIGEGKLVSWGWWEHMVGGKYRRLATYTAADDKTVLKTRGAIIRELIDKHGDAMKEFATICGSHQDYLWEIQIDKP
jgi:hypothetical protein